MSRKDLGKLIGRVLLEGMVFCFLTGFAYIVTGMVLPQIGPGINSFGLW